MQLGVTGENVFWDPLHLCTDVPLLVRDTSLIKEITEGVQRRKKCFTPKCIRK